MACEPNTLANDARCMCLSVEQHMQVQTLLLATLAGGTTDPDILAREARCFCGVPIDTLMAMKSLLLCQFLGEENGGGGGGLPAGPDSEDWTLTLDENFFAIVNVSDNGSGFTEYIYRYRLNGALDWTMAVSNTAVDSNSTIQLYTPGDDVEVQARYMDGATPVSEWSASKFLTPCEGFTSVSNLDGAAERGGLPDGYIANFTWDAHPDQPVVNQLNLQRSDAIGGPYATINAYSSDATSGDDPGPLVPQTDYFYRVQTTFINGCDPVNGTPFELDSGCLAEVPTVDAINIGITNATVTWEPASSDPLQEWVVNWGTTEGGPYPNGVGDIDPGTHEHEITGLDPDTTYYFRVRAVDTETCFATSAEGTFTTEPE